MSLLARGESTIDVPKPLKQLGMIGKSWRDIRLFMRMGDVEGCFWFDVLSFLFSLSANAFGSAWFRVWYWAWFVLSYWERIWFSTTIRLCFGWNNRSVFLLFLLLDSIIGGSFVRTMNDEQNTESCEEIFDHSHHYSSEIRIASHYHIYAFSPLLLFWVSDKLAQRRDVQATDLQYMPFWCKTECHFCLCVSISRHHKISVNKILASIRHLFMLFELSSHEHNRITSSTYNEQVSSTAYVRFCSYFENIIRLNLQIATNY